MNNHVITQDYPTYIHSILSSAQHHMVEYRAERRRVDRPLRLVLLQQLQGRGVEELGGLVLRGRDEHGPVAGQLHVVDLVGVLLDRVQLLAGLLVELGV